MIGKQLKGLLRKGIALAALGILVLCVRRYYHQTVAIVTPQLIETPSDFLPYHQAAQEIVQGNSPYLAPGYIYPPTFAFLLTPLARLDYVTARRIWFGLSQIFLLATAVVVWRAAGADLAAAFWIGIVWALGNAATEALALGQIGPLLTLLVALALTRRGTLQGASVGAGFALKLFPGLLGFAVLLRRERRAIGWMFLSALIAVLLPWAAVATFLKGPIATGGAWTGTPATLSWSLPSVVLRILDPPKQVYPLPQSWVDGTDLERFRMPIHLGLISIAVSLAVLLSGLYFLWRKVHFRLTPAQAPWVMAALLALALAASPISWTHYQVIQYPGVALLLIHLWRRRAWGTLIPAIVLASLLYPVPVKILGDYYERYHNWTAASLSTLYIWTSVTPLASLGLFVVFVRESASAPEAGVPWKECARPGR